VVGLFSDPPMFRSPMSRFRSVSSVLISGKPLLFPDPRSSALIRGKSWVFRSPDHARSSDHQIIRSPSDLLRHHACSRHIPCGQLDRVRKLPVGQLPLKDRFLQLSDSHLYAVRVFHRSQVHDCCLGFFHPLMHVAKLPVFHPGRAALAECVFLHCWGGAALWPFWLK
jgi:hypothetical protein